MTLHLSKSITLSLFKTFLGFSFTFLVPTMVQSSLHRNLQETHIIIVIIIALLNLLEKVQQGNRFILHETRSPTVSHDFQVSKNVLVDHVLI